MALQKILTVTLEFEMGDRKIHTPRIYAAYDAAVAAASSAVEDKLLEGSLTNVRSHMTWDYRYAARSTKSEATEEPENGVVDEMDDLAS